MRIPINAENRSSFVLIESLRLHVIEAGPSDGLPVILLHGFPEFWYGWHRQILSLTEAGCRILAPDQRGYNLSDKPFNLSAYRMDILARDIIGLMDVFEYQKASHWLQHEQAAAVNQHLLDFFNFPEPNRKNPIYR